LDAFKESYDPIIQDQHEFQNLKSDQQCNKYSHPFQAFMNKSKGFRDVIERFKQLLASTEQLPETKRASQLRELLFDKVSSEPTDIKIILDGLVGFYSSPRGNSLKEKNYFDSHACCYGVLTLIPGNKAACDYVVNPEGVDKVLGGNSWHGQPHLRNDRSQVGLCPTCLESLLKMKIDSHHTFLAKIRTSLASNKNSPYAKAATEKEKQLTHELSSLQNNLESVIAAKSMFVVPPSTPEKIVEETEAQPNGQSSPKDEADEADMELLSILQQDSMFDSIRSDEDKQDIPFDQEDESSNSEQSKSIESVRVTRAGKKKSAKKREPNREDNSPQQKTASKTRAITSQKLKLNNNNNNKEVPNTRSRTGALGKQNNNAPAIKQAQDRKRKHEGDDLQTPNKRRKPRPEDNQHVSNGGTTQEQNVLTLRIEDMTCSYPVTTSQVFLFNALAVVVSPEFTKDANLRAIYHDSMSQVDLATLSHLKVMLSLAHTKKCESMGLK
jgi:hypothetical protein